MRLLSVVFRPVKIMMPLSSESASPTLPQLLRHLLASRKKRTREHSRESKYLQAACPTDPTKAILTPLGRPWDSWEQPHWSQNGFSSPEPLDSNGEPLSTAVGARMNTSTLSWARLRCWHVRTQPAILCRETRQRPGGKRGRGRLNPKNSHRNGEHVSVFPASFFAALPTLEEATQSLEVSNPCYVRRMAQRQG
jgi:hypothetical protein